MNSFCVRVNNLVWELFLGISTRGILEIDNPDSVHYATMSYATIRKVLDSLTLGSGDVFVDIGCGKGRVLCCAARYPIREAIGVDISVELCSQARANAERLRGRQSPVLVHNVLAERFDYGQGTVFMMFNPFGAVTLNMVLEKIRHDSLTDGGAIRIVYANPVHNEVFACHSWLTRFDHWDKSKHGTEHSVSFYRSNVVNVVPRA